MESLAKTKKMPTPGASLQQPRIPNGCMTVVSGGLTRGWVILNVKSSGACAALTLAHTPKYLFMRVKKGVPFTLFLW
jgi:hypothetical protein